MSRALGVLLAVAAGGAMVAAARSQTPETKPGYDYAASIAPLRASAIEKLKQAVNIDPASTDAAATQATGDIATIQTSWKEGDLRAIRNRISKLSVDSNTAGYTNVGSAYADAAQAIESVAAAVEARNVALAKNLTTTSSGPRALHGRAHSPLAPRRAVQLHTTRGR